jgi:hypothetical protein
MIINQQKHAVFHLRTAEGFMDLDLPQFALEELDTISEPGEFQIPVLWMIAEALKAQGRFEDAVAPLQHIARTLPAPINEEARKSLSECLEKAGRGSLPQQTSHPTRSFSFQLKPNQSLTIKLGKAS